MSNFSQNTSPNTDRLLAEKYIRLSATKVEKDVRLKEDFGLKKKQILTLKLCSKSEFYRARKSGKKMYTVGRIGRLQKLNTEDELALVTYNSCSWKELLKIIQ